MELGNVRPIKVEDEMKSSYVDYAMSVITARALPDVRDGLKPAQRRILVAMHDLNLSPTSHYRKCAKIAGDTSGNYHPHGEAIVYPTLVRMAQEFNMRYPLVDGQGNFGSIDGDPPAAMRYTEARLTGLAMEMLADIEKDTVDWVPNYEGTRNEPRLLPSRFPNLVCNGSAGIAVGMATNIPPHNLSEVVDALVLLIDNPEATVDDICKVLPGPDFPTGGILITHEKDTKTGEIRDNVKHAYATGHGRVIIRAKAHFEEPRSGRFQIVVTELPYQVNKATLQEKIADLVRDKKLDGISDMRDESDRQGIRLVVETKREANPRTVLNQLYRHTQLQTTFGFNMLALVDGEPRVLTIKKMLLHYLEYRHQVLTRRTRFELEKARARAHVLEGLKIALDHLDAVIRTIRQAPSAAEAQVQLMSRFTLTEIQARAILDMQLRRLAALERQEILDELEALHKTIARLEDLLAHPEKILRLVRDELGELKKKFGDERRTLVATDISGTILDEDLIPDNEMLITLSERGYIKRLPTTTYRSQRRGGKGIRGIVLREEDAPRLITATSNRSNILFFTDRGRVFQLKAHQIPEYDRTAKGLPLINLINLEQGEVVTAILSAPDHEKNEYLVMATRLGEIKKTALKHFAQVRSNGLIAMDLEPGDELGWVRQCTEATEVVLVSEQGKALRFGVDDLRDASRTSGGVKAMKLLGDDRIAGMDLVDPEGVLFIVGAHGRGKLTPLNKFGAKGRNTQGMIAYKVDKDSGPVAATRVVNHQADVILISQSGIVMRTGLADISTQGRTARGVAVMNLKAGDRVAAVALLNDTNGHTHGGDDEDDGRGRARRAATRAGQNLSADSEADQAADSPPSQV